MLHAKAMLSGVFGRQGAGAPSWRDWAFDMRSYVSQFSTELSQAMIAAEVRQTPIPVGDQIHAGIAPEALSDLRHFLVNRRPTRAPF